MQFKTKDLLVTVLPKTEPADIARLCLFRTGICRYPTFHQGTCCLFNSCTIVSPCGHCSVQVTCIGCSIHFTCPGGSCGVCSVLGTVGCGILGSCGRGGSACDATDICPGGSQDPFVIRDVEDLAKLRTELKDTLKSLDEIEKEGLPTAIQSRAEAEALERSLTEALAQVKKAKEGLK